MKDLGCIDPAFHRDDKLAVSGEVGLACETEILPDLIYGKAPGTLREACGAVPADVDHPAFSALPLSAADTLKLDIRFPDSIEHGGIFGNTDDLIERMEDNPHRFIQLHSPVFGIIPFTPYLAASMNT